MINQVTLVGRLTRNPELKMTTEGTPVTNVTLAVSRHYRNQNGEVDADFVQCTLWRKVAENTAAYCRKGSVLGITGRIQTRHYDSHEGKRVYITEVVAENVSFLSSRSHAEPAPGARSNPSYDGSISGTGSSPAFSGSVSETRSSPSYADPSSGAGSASPSSGSGSNPAFSGLTSGTGSAGSVSSTGSNLSVSGQGSDSRSSESFAVPVSEVQNSHPYAGSLLPAPANSQEGLPHGM